MAITRVRQRKGSAFPQDDNETQKVKMHVMQNRIGF
jgi:hypothetical protein